MASSYCVCRGVLNRNPGNIRRDKTKWLGLAPIQTDKSFCQFCKFKYGVRALIKVLHTYYFKHKLHTIRCIISRYAPPTENTTNCYITFVSVQCRCNADVPLKWCDVVTKVAPAICRFESDFNLTPSILSRVVKEFNLL